MYHLPHELQILIYEFDSTYHEIFRQVLSSRFEMYREVDLNFFLIVDHFSKYIYTTDSLEQPTYTCVTFTSRKRSDSLYYWKTYRDYILGMKNMTQFEGGTFKTELMDF